jgi:transposase
MGRGQAYPAELRERAVRLVAESVRNGRGEWDAIRSVTEKLGIGSSETVRKWVRRSQAADDPAAVKASAESAELRQLRAEVRELRRANEILKAAAGFFAAELDRPKRNW